MLRALTVASVLALAGSLANAQQSGFTYQGRVTNAGTPVNGTVNIVARVYESSGNPASLASQTLNNVQVTNGVFTLELNKSSEFGTIFNSGAERWLEISIDGVPQSPRTRILAVPYSIYAATSGAPWFPSAGNATITGRAGVGLANGQFPSARIEIVDTATIGNFPNVTSYTPLKVSNGANQVLLFDSNQIESIGSDLYLNNSTTDGTGKSVIIAGGGGKVSIGNMPLAEKLNVAGSIRVADDSNIFGVDSIVGFNDIRFYGDATGGPDLRITSSGRIGQRADYSNVTFNIRGDVFQGESQHLRVEDFFGISILEVQSDRDVAVNGDFFVTNGSKDFVVDHPLDPSNLNLAHNAVEGPGYYTHYHGNVKLDADGSAWVQLPDYFDALNIDPSYQLTPIGGSAPVYVAEEVSNNRFKIAGGKPGMKVSWQIHATRNDPYAQDHPYQVTRPKDEPGKLLYDRNAPKPLAATAINAGPR